MNSIIVSDLHIGSRYFLSKPFSRFLDDVLKDRTLILNGDTINNPHAKLQAQHQGIIERIGEVSHRQGVVWIRGNHDNGYVPQGLGNVTFTRQYSIGKRLLVVHGDNFDDIMPRNRAFIKAFRIMHDIRVTLGAKPVHVAEYAKKWRAFYRVLRKNVMFNAVSCALENGYQAVACGHTHYAEDKMIHGIRYINTGAWTESPAYYLLVTDDDLALIGMDDESGRVSPN